ncbi:hypothetical protein ACLOJK_028629 [Asimina triloba]
MDVKGVEQYSSLLRSERRKRRMSKKHDRGSAAAAASGLGFAKRCTTIVKQQRTRFYILRRCITMLLCWHAHAVRD